MREAEIEYILSRIVKKANDALEESKENKDDDFYKGRKFAYYEILDAIKNELIARDQDLKEFGLDINLEKTFL